MDKRTKVKDVLALLRRSGWVDQQVLLDVGGHRYGARIYDIRKLGLVVEKKQLGRSHFEYRLARGSR